MSIGLGAQLDSVLPVGPVLGAPWKHRRRQWRIPAQTGMEDKTLVFSPPVLGRHCCLQGSGWDNSQYPHLD